MDEHLQKIHVESRQAKDGQWYPIKFTWQMNTYAVESTGRRWSDTDGKHILVRTQNRQVYELILDNDLSTWYINLRTVPPMAA